MTVEVQVWATPQAFLVNLGAVDEVQGCIVHGMANTWISRPDAFRAGTPLLTATIDGTVVAAALQASAGKVIFSLGPTEAILALAGWWEKAGRRPHAVVVPEAARTALVKLWPGYPTLENTLYALREPPPPPATPGLLRRARAEEKGWLTDWVLAFHKDARLRDDPKASLLVESKLAAGHLFIWDDAVPRAMAALAGPTPRSVRINTVYTPEVFRRHGYGSAAVAALARMEIEAGREVVQLFADRSLDHTNRMYKEIGFEPVADFVDLELSPASTPSARA
jgi:GNAT superfamily N-acetyltransferase